MEDILASIRRILSEEEAEAEAKQSQAVGEPKPDEPAHDVLLLNEDMIVPDPAVSEPISGPDILPPDPPAPMLIPETAPPPLLPEHLVAPAAAQAAATSLGALVRTLAQERTTAVSRGGPTIEDLVRDEMRPLLKEWLDVHLAPLVERVVRAEIERVVGRSSP